MSWVVSERYPSGHNARVLGKGHARPWVAIIEGGYKAVGPSSSGFALYDVETSGFDVDHPVNAPEIESSFREWVDLYWSESADRREFDGQLSEQERRRLRALGYID